MNKQINLVWVLPILMLLLSFLHLPYGYYTLLRIIVTGCAGYLAYLEYKRTQTLSLFVLLFALLALLFNPLIPIYFSKSVWMGIDIFTALIFGLHAHTFRDSHEKS